jgi:hypothetical protein
MPYERFGLDLGGHFAPNYALAGATNLLISQEHIWFWKALLTGEAGTGGYAGSGKWAVIWSSDGVTAGMDGVDRLRGTPYTGQFSDPGTAAKFVRAAAGSPHSGITLKSPDALGPYYLTLDYVTAADNRIAVIYSKNAPTGGSITARPTATDEWVHTSFVPGQVDEVRLNDGSAAVCHVNGAVSSLGDFILFAARQGSLYAQSAFWAIMPADAQPEDTYKLVTLAVYNNDGVSDRGVCRMSNPNMLPQEQLNDSSGSLSTCMLTRRTDIAGKAAVRSYDYGTIATTGTTGNRLEATSGVQAADSIANRRRRLPLFLQAYNITPTYWASKGRLPDIYWAMTDTQGQVAPDPGTVEHVQIGNTWLPMPEAPSL